jgi:type VI protein secretion system component VasK
MGGYQRRALRRESNLPMPNLLGNAQEVELITARMAHFCRLLFRDRQPYCPLNGILVLVPLGATDTDIDAQQSADLLNRDLMTVRQVLKVRCPMFAMLVDMEQVPGFNDFIQRRSASERSRRIGQRFPLAPPDVTEETLHERLDESVKWLADNVVRDLVYRVFKVETGQNGKLDVNHELFLLLEELRERKEHLGRFVVQGLARDVDPPLLFGGCYLAATGADRERDQGFTRGVLQRLFDSQDLVAWTDQALIEDARSHRLTFAGYAFLVLAIGLVGAGIAYTWFGPRGS